MSISSTLFQHAEIQFHQATDSLRAFVGCFWVVTADRNATIRVVPDSSTAISMQLVEGEPTGWTLRGPLIRPDERRFKSPAIMIGVRLRPGVAFILSGIAAQATVGRRIRLSEIPAFHELVSAEAELRTPEQCINALQGFLVQSLKDARVQDGVATAMREIERAHGCVRVAEVAARCGVSPRHLNRLMRIWVGYGPKCFASIVRFQESLKQIDHSPSQPAAVLASETGFFDQSHMSLNLTKFAGATPGHLTSKCVADFSKTRCEDLP